LTAGASEEEKENKKELVSVPDVTEENSKTAINMLRYAELKHIIVPESDENNSFLVVDQYPKAGTKVEKGSYVYIYSE
jgi:stage V sporulation protein D (sporulation-specific penicillin-binding protein)